MVDNIEIEKQIYDKRREVRYDIRDLTVEIITEKFEQGKEYEPGDSSNTLRRNILFIPDYQRDFTWDHNRQSKLIESIILGLPIPFIFVAENKDSSWEIVDGSQRIRTIHSFISNELTLCSLETLKIINGLRFSDLDTSRQGKILDTALRMIVLSEETSDDVKKDMFERINRGSDLLKPMEKRKGIYQGDFLNFIYDYGEHSTEFNELLKLDKWLQKRQEKEELLLRFFALSDKENYKNGVHGGIAAYLDKYIEKKNSELKSMTKEHLNEELKKYKSRIEEVVSFVSKYFPYGFRQANTPQTKRSVFEAISVGTYLALESGKINEDLTSEDIRKLMDCDQFKRNTHVANELHKKEKLVGRIEFIRDMLIRKP